MGGQIPGAAGTLMGLGAQHGLSTSQPEFSRSLDSKALNEREHAFHGPVANNLLIANNPCNLYSHARLADAIQEGLALNYQQHGRRKSGGLFHGFQSKVKLEGFTKDYLNKIRG